MYAELAFYLLSSTLCSPTLIYVYTESHLCGFVYFQIMIVLLMECGDFGYALRTSFPTPHPSGPLCLSLRGFPDSHIPCICVSRGEYPSYRGVCLQVWGLFLCLQALAHMCLPSGGLSYALCPPRWAVSASELSHASPALSLCLPLLNLPCTSPRSLVLSLCHCPWRTCLSPAQFE